jgi:hypothetical protein
LAAIRPGLTTLRGQLLSISSPFSQRGPLFELYDTYFGKDDPSVLVWRAPTRVMNPLIPERTITDALDRDEAIARSEWLAEWRTDRESSLTRERLASVIPAGVTERPPLIGAADHCAFVDAASGSGADAMTLAIAHGEQEGEDGPVIAVLDKVLEVRPPFSPVAVARMFAAEVQRYGGTEVVGDLYAKGWVGSAFESAGVRYVPATWTRSELYVRTLVGINSNRVELLDVERLIQQFTALERRVGASGRDSIDHAGGGHDDVANACAGAVALVLQAANVPELRILEG